jgi:O-succinylbenzoic acid--CoA ligase
MNRLVDLSNNVQYQEGSPFLLHDTVTTFGEFTDKVNQQSLYLYNSGIRQNDIVPVILHNSPFYLESVFALWKIGAVPALLNTRLTNPEIKKLIDFIEPAHIISDENNFTGINVITGSGPGTITGKLPHAKAEADKTAIIIFTSGSTGTPKGVEITFGNLIASAENANAFMIEEFKPRTHHYPKSWLASLPFYHIGGFSVVIRALLSGSAVIFPYSHSAEDICFSINNHKPAYISLVSTQLKRLLELECYLLKEVSAILLGGGFIDEELINKAVNSGINIAKGYGSSETSSFVCALNCNNNLKPASSGKPVCDNEIVITDNNGNTLPSMQEGEILIKGRTVAKGYYKNYSLSEEKFKDGYFHSGDIGYTDEEGYLFVAARRTDLIISGGENINPREVEQALLKHPDINEAVVIGIEDKLWGHTPAAVLVTNNNKKITQPELKQFLKNKIAGFKIPSLVKIVECLPRTSLGKIRREKLKELFKEN